MGQNYANHRRWVPPYHFVAPLILLAVFIGSIVNVIHAAGTPAFYSTTLILALTFACFFLFYYLRAFPLRAQDRLIRVEENLRHQRLTNKPLDSRLTLRQIIGLRFASDEEFAELAKKALQENLSEDQIKKAVKNWREDSYRV